MSAGTIGLDWQLAATEKLPTGVRFLDFALRLISYLLMSRISHVYVLVDTDFDRYSFGARIFPVMNEI